MILACGEALIDFLPVALDGETAYVPRAGGSLFNVAIALGRLGTSVGFLGRLSRDPFGRMLRRRLEEDGVDTRYVQDGDEPSTLAIVHLAPGGEAVYAFHGEGTADRLLRVGDLPSALPPEVTDVHFGSISLVREPGASTFEVLMGRERSRRLISLDPNVRPNLVGPREAYVERLEGWVSLADVVKVSLADLAWTYPGEDPGAVAAAWRARGPALVVVTRGGDGALALGPGGRVDVPGTPVEVADTVGAGDAFTAGLLAWLDGAERLDRARIREIPSGEVRAALAFANAAAAISCTRVGAQPPTRTEMRAAGFA